MSSIARLPEQTTRLLGSSLNITSPISLVKELLDNAIDANATAIEVLISPDTVSSLEVRDNGTGIHSDDYDSLARPGHTSKLTSFEDLATHGCKTLGFRGDALASITAIANLTITTKTANDPTAAVLHILPDSGGVGERQMTAGPVGTSVRVSGLFGRMPVRQQVAEKEASKNLERVRDLLRSYAMARPHLRLSFKVRKAPALDLSYSPKSNATAKEALLQIFGRDAASACREKKSRLSAHDGSQIPGATSVFPSATEIEAEILFANTAETSRLPKCHYFSVDGRPVNAKRGIFKKILAIYSRHLSKTIPGSVPCRPTDCFIRLNLICPPGVYDPNIEPAKDEVMFSDEDTLLAHFDILCQTIYSGAHGDMQGMGKDTCDASQAELFPSGIASVTPIHSDSNEKDLTGSTPLGVATGNGPDHPEDDSPVNASEIETWVNTINNMHPHNMARQTSDGHHGVTRAHIPWTQAQPAPQVLEQHEDMELDKDQMDSELRSDLSQREDFGKILSIQGRKRPLDGTDSAFDDFTSSTRSEDMRLISSGDLAVSNGSTPGGSETQPPSIYHPSQKAPVTPRPAPYYKKSMAPGDLDLPPRRKFLSPSRGGSTSTTNVPGGAFRSPLPSPTAALSPREIGGSPAQPKGKRPRASAQVPWTPPSSVPRRTGVKDGPYGRGELQRPMDPNQTTINFRTANNNLQRSDPEQMKALEIAENDNEGFGTMFSSARRCLEYQLSGQVGPQPGGPATNLQPAAQAARNVPLSHRQARAISLSLSADTAPVFTDKEPIATSLPSNDPRAYLLRRQKSMTADVGAPRSRKIRRMKTDLLPLEHVPTDFKTHAIAIRVRTNVLEMRRSMNDVGKHEKYVTDQALEDGLDMGQQEGLRVQERLESLISCLGDDAEGKKPGIDICSLLLGKASAGI